MYFQMPTYYASDVLSFPPLRPFTSIFSVFILRQIIKLVSFFSRVILSKDKTVREYFLLRQK